MPRSTAGFHLLLVATLAFATACGQTDDSLESRPDEAPGDTAATTGVSPGSSEVMAAESPSTVPVLTTPGGTEIPVVESPPPNPDAGPVPLCDDVDAIKTDLDGEFVRWDDIFLALVNQYGAERPDQFGGMWLDRASGGVAMIGFTDDLDSHRTALASLTADDLQVDQQSDASGPDGPLGEREFAWDVVEVTYTEIELLALQSAVFEAARQWPVEVVGAGSRGPIQRVALDLAETTPGALDELARFVDADVVCVEGTLLDPDRTAYEPGDDLDVIVRPDADGAFPTGTTVGCGGSSFPMINALEPTYLTDAGRTDLLDGIETVATEFGVENAAVEAIADTWVLLDENDDEALVYSPDGREFSELRLQRFDDGSWGFAGSASGGGDCNLRLQLPDGLGAVEWTLDPNVPLDRSSATLALLAEELACSGAREMGDQLLGPQVVETDTEVFVTFAVIPLTGPQNCPGNPRQSVTVDLDAPLGDRTLRDGLSTGLTLDDLVER